MTEDMNRLKLILVEKKKTSKWLADELGVPPYHRVEMVHELIAARLGHRTENHRPAED